MRCAPCKKDFATWRAFQRHMDRVHRISPANLKRRADQLAGHVDLVAIQSEAGQWFLFGQGPLL